MRDHLDLAVAAPGVVCGLGDGPTWDPDDRLVRWVDIAAGRVWQAGVLAGGPGSAEARPVGLGDASIALDLGPTVGCAVPVHPAAGGGLVVARTRTVEHRGPDGRVLGELRLVPDGVRSRLNDGACDPEGRLVVGSVALDGRRGADALWRVEPDGSARVLDDAVSMSNGIGWSPDGAVLYHADSAERVVWARDYAAAVRPGPPVGSRRVLARFDAVPDGLAVDADGCVWVALWGGGRLVRLAPDGRVDGEVGTGAPLTTGCAFVGEDLDLLVVTTAARGWSGEPYPAPGGSLLVLRPGVRGRAPSAWSGVYRW